MFFLLLPASSSAGAWRTSHGFLLNAMYFLHISLSEALFVPSFKPALGPPSLRLVYTVCVDRSPFPYLGYWNVTQDSQGLNLYAFWFSPMTFFKSWVFVLWYSYISSPKLNLTFSALYDMLKLFLQREENSSEWVSGKLTKSCCLPHMCFL